MGESGATKGDGLDHLWHVWHGDECDKSGRRSSKRGEQAMECAIEEPCVCRVGLQHPKLVYDQ